MPPTLTPTPQVSPTGLPTELPEHFSHLYVMYYRHGINAQLSKGFYFNGDLKEAIERARKHCEIMGYKYAYTRPLVPSLDEEEKRYI